MGEIPPAEWWHLGDWLTRQDELQQLLAELLKQNIALLRIIAGKDGVPPPIPPTEPPPETHVMEYYDFDEAVALPVTTAPAAPHEFKERPVKFMWLYARGAAMQVSINRAVSGDSMVIPAGSIIWVKRKTSRVYGRTLAGIGMLYIWGFW